MPQCKLTLPLDGQKVTIRLPHAGCVKASQAPGCLGALTFQLGEPPSTP
jgi:hypothetical protein